MESKRIIGVTGSNGQLGSELRDLASMQPGTTFHFFTRENLAIDDEAALRAVFSQYGFTHWINCAAYTAVDLAEKEREAAFRINGEAVGIMASLCREYNTRLIHISTDYVFNGTATAPIAVDAKTDPVNAYGASKLLGEELAMQYNPGAVIIRTSWVYSAYGKNFVKTMLRLMKEKESIGVVTDQVGSPTYAADLAEAILSVIAAKNWVPGIYHFSNAGVISWFQFATAIKELSDSTCTVNPITSDQFPTPARRPSYSGMDLSALEKAYGIVPRNWKDALQRCLQKLSQHR